MESCVVHIQLTNSSYCVPATAIITLITIDDVFLFFIFYFMILEI